MAFNTSQFQTGAFNGNQFGNFMSGGFTSPTNQKKQEDDTYNPRYPGFNKENYEKLERKVAALGLTGSKKQEVMDEFYRQILPQVENEKIKSQRNEAINQKSYEISQIKDESGRKIAEKNLSVEQLAQMVKEKENLREDAPDAAVFNAWIKSIPNGGELLANYMNNGDDTLLYKGGLKKETGWQKVGDVATGFAQSPGKWGYNILGQRIDRGAEKIAGGLENMLNDEQKQQLYDWSKGAVKWMGDKLGFDTSKITDADFEEYAKQRQQELENGTAFNGREQTDITKTWLGSDYRANNGWTKGGEIAGDIASGIALTAPMGAALAPAIANGSVLGAGLAGGAEGLLDTAVTHLGSQGNLDLTPTEIALGVGGGVLGGELTRYLANMPKSQADNIRKEAEGYINKSIKPKTNAKVSQSDVNKFTDDVLDVAKVMSKNKGTEVLQYTDDAGNIVTGKLPTNLRETTETLSNLKKVVYDQYDDIARKAGDAGARVDLNKLFDNLDDLTKDTAQNLSNSNTLSIVDDWKNRLLQYSDDAGTISIGDAQKTVQDLNNQLTTFFKNVSNSADDVSKNAIKAKVNRWMLDAIDDSIDDTLSAGIKNTSNMSAAQEYTQLRQFYGKIKNIEGEIAKKTMQDMKKMPGMTSQLLDALSGGEFTQAILSLDPVTFGKAGAIKLLNKYFQYMSNPNVNINKLFKLVDSVNNPSAISSTITNVSDAVRQGLQNSANVIPKTIIPGTIAAGESLSSK